MKIKTFINPNNLIIIFFIISLILGGLITQDYGKSWDEDRYYEYGYTTAKFYANPSLGFSAPVGAFGRANHQYYGPFYIVVANLYENIGASIFDKWNSPDFYHFFYFITFQIGVIILFQISKRFMSAWAALAAALLFGTQPLLVGHAFINPKDIPFMVFFMASIYSGLLMVEHFEGKTNHDVRNIPSNKTTIEKIYFQDILKNWKQIISLRKKLVIVLGIIWLFFLSSYIISSFFLETFIARIISTAYYADPSTPLGALFSKIAESASLFPLEHYQTKGDIILVRISSILLILSILSCPFITFPFTQNLKRNFIIAKRHFSKAINKQLPKQILSQIKMSMNIKTTIRSFSKVFNKQLPKQILSHINNRNVIMAGVLLGITSSLRVIGPLSGGFIAYYFYQRRKHKSIPPLITYSIIGSITTLITWPYLWRSPISRYIEAVRIMINYPWDNKVLFNGQAIDATSLPASYLPTFLTFQLTEPLVILAALGLVLIFFQQSKGLINNHKLHLISLWFFSPLVYVIITKPVLYDNGRQFLFIYPPLFIFAGITLDYFKDKLILKNKCFYLFIILILILPGIINAVNLHPYEYIYYNSFTGGVEGAFRRYELDYWATSLKEIMDFLNQQARPGAKIIIAGGPPWIPQSYAREDITIEPISKTPKDTWAQYDYEIILNRLNKDLQKSILLGPIIHKITRDNAILSIAIEIEK